VRDCARIAQRRRLLLEFTLIGHVARAASSASEPLRQTGRYVEDLLPTLIANADPHVLWFPSQVPESYSFTLGAALRSGRPVVANDLGALSERLRGVAWAWLTSPQWGVEQTLEFFLDIRRKNFLRYLPPPTPSGPNATPDGFYENEYLLPPHQ
jgi:hypothetical protein